MKTKFEGIINGKKYDSVEEYNKAITGLIDSGATKIDASSRTWMESDETEHETTETDKTENNTKSETKSETRHSNESGPTNSMTSHNINTYIPNLYVQKDLDELTGLAKDGELIHKYSDAYKTDSLEGTVDTVVKIGLGQDYADIIEDEYNELTSLMNANRDTLQRVEDTLKYNTDQIHRLESIIDLYKEQIKGLSNDIAEKTKTKNILANAGKILDIKEKYLSKAGEIVYDKLDKTGELRKDDDRWPMTFSELVRKYFS